jgi:hypothetical protein
MFPIVDQFRTGCVAIMVRQHYADRGKVNGYG